MHAYARKVASIAWISAVHRIHSSSSGGGGSALSRLGNSNGGGSLRSVSGSQHSSLWGNRRGLLVLRGLLGFGAGSTLYWTVRSSLLQDICG